MKPLPRRAFLKFSAAGVALAWLPAGCGSDDGPGAIKLDRDACDFCRMLISEIRYAAEVRGGPNNKLYKFDDIGCAVLFLNRVAWGAEPAVKVWAMSFQDGATWLDARLAAFLQGLPSPMGYGFAAAPSGTAGTISYEAMRVATLKKSADVSG